MLKPSGPMATSSGINGLGIRSESLHRLQRSQGVLANLLGKTGTRVLFSGLAETASINIESGTITLPNIMYFFDYIEKTCKNLVAKMDYVSLYSLAYDVYTGFVIHEVAHSLYTPKEYPDRVKAVASDTGIHIGYVSEAFNIFEDARIEKMVVRDFPGTQQYLNKEYEYLIKMGKFFKNSNGGTTDDYQKWVDVWASFSLIDKINIYAKVRFVVNPHVYDFRKRLFKTKEANDFMDRALATETFEEVEDLVRDFLSSIKFVVPSFSKNEEEETDQDEQEQTDEKVEAEEDQEPEDKEEEEEGEQEPQYLGEFEFDISKLENPPEEEPSHDDLNKDFIRSVFYESEGVKYEHVDMPDPNIDDFTVNAWGESVYNDHIKSERYLKAIRNDATTFNDINLIAGHMNGLFQQMKSADSYRRELIAKTGDINPNSLYRYRIDDDIFNTKTIVPGDDNHGVIFVVDASASMSDSVKYTAHYLASMLKFCDMARIPYKAFLFPGKSSLIDKGVEYDNGNFLNINASIGSLEYLTSSNDPKRSSAIAFLANVSAALIPARVLSYGNTPLAEAALNAFALAKIMKEQQRIQHMSVVFITDGGAAPVYYTSDKRCVRNINTAGIPSQKRFLTYNKENYPTFRNWFHLFSEWSGVRCINWFIESSGKSLEILDKPFHGHPFHLTLNSSKDKLSDKVERKKILTKLISEISGYDLSQYKN